MNFLYAEINVVGIILLLLFLNNMNRSGIKAVPFDQYLFNGCIVMNILIFLFDTRYVVGGWPRFAYPNRF